MSPAAGTQSVSPDLSEASGENSSGVRSPLLCIVQENNDLERFKVHTCQDIILYSPY